MKKTALIAIAILSALLLTLPMPIRPTDAVDSISLAYDVTPSREEFIEIANADMEPAGGELEDPTPFWVDMVDAEYYTNRGEGIYVAVLDTGLLAQWPFFFPHADIKTEWGKGFTHDIWWDDDEQDFMMGPLRDDRGFITKAYEGSGHGTHVTSIIVGYNFNNLFMVDGVAPKVTIIPVLVLDAWAVPYPGGTARFSGGTYEMVTAGINYVAWLAETYGVKIIINMSLGGSAPSPMEEAAIDYAISKGVIIVCSAGNNYYGMGWPGAFPQVISAAAGGWTEGWITRPPQTRWWLNDVVEKLNTKDYWGNNWQMFLEDFSSRPAPELGQSWKDLDVCAPGAAVVGPHKPYFSTGLGYYYVWGTSQAAPHVSGIAAIVAQQYPGLNQADMECILKRAAAKIPMAADGAYALDSTPWWFYWNDHDAGSGWLQADEALKSAFVYSMILMK